MDYLKFNKHSVQLLKQLDMDRMTCQSTHRRYSVSWYNYLRITDNVVIRNSVTLPLEATVVSTEFRTGHDKYTY